MGRRENAIGLYMEGIRDGRPAEALEKYLGARYTQHSTGIASGKEGFMEFFIPFLERNSDRDIRVLRTIEDGRYVFCHVFQSLNRGEAEWVTMDLFDTDDEGKIVEHWDVIAKYGPTPSGLGMIDGPGHATDLDQTEANKSRIREFTKRVLIERRTHELDEYIAPDVLEHSPRLGPGLAGWQAGLGDDSLGQYDMLFELVGEGDLVVAYSRVYRGDADHAVFDLYRLADGLIVEHWDTSEEIGPRETWNNSGKF